MMSLRCKEKEKFLLLLLLSHINYSAEKLVLCILYVKQHRQTKISQKTIRITFEREEK